MKNINIHAVLGVIFVLLNLPFLAQGQKKCTKCDSTEKKPVRIRIISFQAGDPTFKTALRNKDSIAVNKFDVTAILYAVNKEGAVFDTDTVYNHVVGRLKPNEKVTIMSCFDFEGEYIPDSIRATLILYDTIDCSINFAIEDDTATINFGSSASCPHNSFQSNNIPYLKSGEPLFIPEDGDIVVFASRDETNPKVFLEAILDSTTTADTMVLDTIKLVSTFNSLKMQGAKWKLRKVKEGGDSIFYLQPLLPDNDNYVLGLSDSTFILVDINSENANAKWNLQFLEATKDSSNVHHLYLNGAEEGQKNYLYKKENSCVGITTSLLEKKTKWYIHKLTD
ncbi:hypothetical protein [Aureispira anguillae]|uniref:Uncharacterized protein n=1 Tax=Aureispira anguillae TaxID=2864201 RepID=A0A915YBS8_9BACT|nr:hypothetical protein [Aureispira anguillae]BDS10188.1 hypothetical protein AsAng_0008960 [Aureispira anguillae]